jgi:hypothetical protein
MPCRAMAAEGQRLDHRHALNTAAPSNTRGASWRMSFRFRDPSGHIQSDRQRRSA